MKTPVGKSYNATVNNTIMQGETLSSILCTNSVDKIGKDCEIKPCEYRMKAIIPQMSFVDDILDIKNCGKDTKQMNDYTTEQVNLRKLQLNKDKCARMHIKSKNVTQNECESVVTDEWTVDKGKKGSRTVLQDRYKGKISIKTVTEYTYSGGKILPDSRNRLTIGRDIKWKLLKIIKPVLFSC